MSMLSPPKMILATKQLITVATVTLEVIALTRNPIFTLFHTEVESQLSPLETILQGSATDSQMAVMIERLNVSERIIHMSSASVVSPGMEQYGEILISHTAMYFVGEKVTIDMNQVKVSFGHVIVLFTINSMILSVLQVYL